MKKLNVLPALRNTKKYPRITYNGESYILISMSRPGWAYADEELDAAAIKVSGPLRYLERDYLPEPELVPCKKGYSFSFWRYAGPANFSVEQVDLWSMDEDNPEGYIDLSGDLVNFGNEFL